MDIYYNDIDLSDDPYYAELLDVEKPFLPGIRLSIAPYGAIDGAAAQGGALDALSIQCPLAIYGEDITALNEVEDALRALIDRRNLRSLRIGRWPDRYWMVRPYGEIPVEYTSEGMEIITLNFIAPNPRSYAVLETEIIEELAGPTTIDVDSDDVAESTDTIHPTLDIEFDGDAEEVTFESLTTGEIFVWTGVRGAGEFLRIDCGAGICYTSDDGLTWTRSFESTAGRYPTLLPAADNSLRVSGVTAGEATLTFRQTYGEAPGT